MSKNNSTERMLKKIANLVDGNNASKNDVKYLSCENLDTQIFFKSSWTFGGDYKDASVNKGGWGKHFNDKSSADDYTQEIINGYKNDQKLKQDFLQNLKENAKNAFTQSSKHLGKVQSFSYSITCDSCNGRGRDSCHYCGGQGGEYKRKDIYSSEGRYLDTQTYYENCQYCYGSGYLTCNYCSGRGENYFFRTVNAAAKASCSVIFKCEKYAQYANSYLRSKDPEFLYAAFDFEFIKICDFDSDDDTISFAYKTDAVLTRLDFSVLDKTYSCLYFVNTQEFFAKPSIFNDLLYDEIKFLSNFNKEQKINKKMARQILDKLKAKPVLKTALDSLLQDKKNIDQNEIARQISRACDGFISLSACYSMSVVLKKCFNKFYPKFRLFIWFGIILIIIVGAFFLYKYNIYIQNTQTIYRESYLTGTKKQTMTEEQMVIAIQEILIKNGYKLKADGKFGQKTKAALNDFFVKKLGMSVYDLNVNKAYNILIDLN